MPFSPTKAIIAGIADLPYVPFINLCVCICGIRANQAGKDVNSSNDMLINLLESIKDFAYMMPPYLCPGPAHTDVGLSLQ